MPRKHPSKIVRPAPPTPAATPADVGIPNAPDGASLMTPTPDDLRAKEEAARKTRVDACRREVAVILDRYGCMLDWTATIEYGAGPEGQRGRVIVPSVGVRSK